MDVETGIWRSAMELNFNEAKIQVPITKNVKSECAKLE